VRLLLINQFYPPDAAPTGVYLHALARALVERGHSVRVLCSRASYVGEARYPAQETRDGVVVRRVGAIVRGRGSLPRRLADALSSLGLLACHAACRGPRPDVILSLTSPPFVGVVGKVASRLRRARHAHWVMDLYPDVLEAHGWLRRGSASFRLLRFLTRRQLAGSSLTLTLGPHMARSVGQYGPCAWVPLWGLESASARSDGDRSSLREERGWQAQDLVLMYSGNMGLGHRFGEFLEAARRLGPGGPRWAFVGGGPRRGEIEVFARSHPSLPIDLLPYAPESSLHDSLSSADVHLASLDARWQGLMVPSKIQASFSVGRPVIFVGGRESELAHWTSASGGGWVVDQGDVSGLLAAIEEARDASERTRRGQAALAYAREHFSPQRNLEQIADLVENLSEGTSLAAGLR
jgi:colanic acid biosynthesis glycosyl transferase WcaI